MTALVEEVRRLQGVLISEYHTSPDLFDEIARMEALLAETYRDRFLYELLQNSDDAGSRAVRIDFDTSGKLAWENDGRPLTAADVESLCRSARSTKQRGDVIGYRGIGFKSLAAVAKTIAVESAGARFRFDRAQAASLVDAGAGAAMPLIRIPTDVDDAAEVSGVRFTIDRHAGVAISPAAIDPLALLFLRNLRRIEITGAVSTVLETVRSGDTLRLVRTGHQDATFALRDTPNGEVAVPLDAAATSLTGVHGRLSCFLPLADHLGVPGVVSGYVLTDPSRTHAVTDDAATRDVVRDAARAVVAILNEPDDPLFDRLWQLALEAEDPRVVIDSPTSSVPRLFWTAVQEAAAAQHWSFPYSPIGYGESDVDSVLPDRTPRALYLESHRAAARALKAVLGLPTAEVARQITPAALQQLAPATRQKVIDHVVGTARAYGRPLTSAETELVGDRAELPSPTRPTTSAPVSTARTRAPMGEHMKRWRVAEKSVLSYLGGLGWELEDVSLQNLGYDLAGRDARNEQVFVEVKKVDGPDGRFALTPNEMSFLQSRRDRYWLAMVVGDGRSTQLMMIHAGSADLPFERVCRRWDWECSEWSAAGQIV